MLYLHIGTINIKNTRCYRQRQHYGPAPTTMVSQSLRMPLAK